MGKGSIKRRDGFTIIELMIVVTIIATIASIAIPNLLSAKLVANETAAIAALRSIASAQSLLQQRGLIDVDGNGIGEYGFFGEIAGTAALRGTTTFATPPAMAASFGKVTNSQVSRSGYLFQIYLPDVNGAGVAEDFSGGCGAPCQATVGATNSSVFWCAYAWPVRVSASGQRVFFVNQQGELLQSANIGANGAPIYADITNGPQPAAAYLNPLVAGDITGASAVGNTGNDGNPWLTVTK